jgi:hypothetical protein
MDKIYQFARHTIIYLGEATPETDMIMRLICPRRKNPISCLESEFLSNVSQLFTVRQSKKASSRRSNEQQLSARRQGNMSDDLHIQPLVEKHMLNRLWFSRTWILQELVLSADPWLQVGNRRVRWKVFCDFLLKNTNSSDLVEPLLILSGMNNTRLSQQTEAVDDGVSGRITAHMLLRILRLRRGFGVTDPRDMIYAHLGMVQNKDSTAPLQVNYRTPATQVYIEFALYCLWWTGNLEFLSQIGDGYGKKSVLDLPSWVPDWTTFGVSSNPLDLGFINWDTKGIELIHAFRKPNVLACLGSVVDIVRVIKIEPPPSVDLEEIYAQAVQDCRKAAKGTNSYHQSNHPESITADLRSCTRPWTAEDEQFRQLIERMYAKLLNKFYTWLAEPTFSSTYHVGGRSLHILEILLR